MLEIDSVMHGLNELESKVKFDFLLLILSIIVIIIFQIIIFIIINKYLLI